MFNNKSLIITIIGIIICTIMASVDCYDTQKGQGNVEHPLGDEELNNNILDYLDIFNFESTEQKCPPAANKNADPNHVPCRPQSGITEDLIYSSDSTVLPESKCKKCDIRLTADSSGVILTCFDCYDLRPGANIEILQSRFERRRFSALVHYLQIANYTSPDGNSLYVEFNHRQ